MNLPKIHGLHLVFGYLAKQVQEVQTDVKNKLENANAKYTMETDKQIWFKSLMLVMR